jgi:hypothetical protein
MIIQPVLANAKTASSYENIIAYRSQRVKGKFAQCFRKPQQRREFSALLPSRSVSA